LRTLGWDFAITEKDLKMIKTNVADSAPNISGKMDKIVGLLLWA
jgi:hypothetical protein